MSVELVTGYYGVGEGGEPKRHVSSTEDGARQAGTVGLGCYALSTGSKLSATMEDANTLVVADGDVMMNGRHVSMPDATSFTIPTGVQGQKVSNLAVLRYQVGSDSVESVTPVVLTGEPSADTPTDPAYSEGSILDGDSPVDMPLYRVVTDGISVGDPEPLFETIPTIDSLRDSVSQVQADLPSGAKRITVSGVTASYGGGTVPCDAWRLSGLGIAIVQVPVSKAGRSLSFPNQSSGIWLSETVTVKLPSGLVASNEGVCFGGVRNGHAWIVAFTFNGGSISFTVATTAKDQQPYQLTVAFSC